MISANELLKKIEGVFYFATVENGQPRVRPFGFAMVFEDKLYFGCGTHKAAYQQMLADPHVELCTFTRGSTIRVRGKAAMDDRPEVQQAMYAAAPGLKDKYNEQNGRHHICFYLDEMSAYEFKGETGIQLV